MNTPPSPRITAIAQEAVDNSCVDLWLSLRTLIDVTEDTTDTENKLMALICTHPAVQREIADRAERAST